MSSAQNFDTTYPHGPTCQPELHLHQSTSCSLFLPIHSNSSLSLCNPKPWRSFIFSPTIEAPPPHGSFTEGCRRLTLTSCTTSTSCSSLELGASPSFSLHLSPLPQASSKKDELELHQASSTILQPLPVFHSSPVSSSPARSISIVLDLEAMKPL
jgi:hypothetical protein